MDISTNNALTAISYGAAAGALTMAAANVVLVGAGASAKAGAFVADYFKNDSVAQNLRIKGDQLVSLAGKYAATELKVAAALVAVGGGAVLTQYAMNNEIPSDKMAREVQCDQYKNHDTCITEKIYEKHGMSFDRNLAIYKGGKNFTEHAEYVAIKAKARDARDRFAKEQETLKQVQQQAHQGVKSPTPTNFIIVRQGMPDVDVIEKNQENQENQNFFSDIKAVAEGVYSFVANIMPPKEAIARL